MAMRRDIVSPKAAQSRPKTVAVGLTLVFSNLDKVARLIPQIVDNSSSDHPRSVRSVLNLSAIRLSKEESVSGVSICGNISHILELVRAKSNVS